MTSEKYSSSNAAKPEKFDSDGYVLVELGWYYDFSGTHFLRHLGCQNVTNSSYYLNTNCFCTHGQFSGFSYTNCFCDTEDYEGNPYLRGGCVGT